MDIWEDCPRLAVALVEQIFREEAEEPVTLTFSELASYRSCGFAYRLRNLLGFQPFLAQELGYGKAVHHVLRAIAEYTLRHGHAPSFQEVRQMLDDGFFLPTASKPAHRLLKESARQLLRTYLTEYETDLERVWETERPFEPHLPKAIITGRADVILDTEGGRSHR
jgi:DNA helicase-2/ATP-dependent DNA helicase PcrA